MPEQWLDILTREAEATPNGWQFYPADIFASAGYDEMTLSFGNKSVTSFLFDALAIFYNLLQGKFVLVWEDTDRQAMSFEGVRRCTLRRSGYLYQQDTFDGINRLLRENSTLAK